MSWTANENKRIVRRMTLIPYAVQNSKITPLRTAASSSAGTREVMQISPTPSRPSAIRTLYGRQGMAHTPAENVSEPLSEISKASSPACSIDKMCVFVCVCARLSMRTCVMLSFQLIRSLRQTLDIMTQQTGELA
jgi:hypothetical protein